MATAVDNRPMTAEQKKVISLIQSGRNWNSMIFKRRLAKIYAETVLGLAAMQDRSAGLAPRLRSAVVII